MTTKKIINKAHEKEISIRYSLLAGFFWILTIIWIIVIFHLSSENASESSDLFS